jgi:hypothetical protein
MLSTRAPALVASWLFSMLQSSAQVEGVTPSQGAAKQQETHLGCPGAVAFWAGSGPEVHVTRVGSMEEFNPLTSASSGPPIVLEIRIRGKLTAAYGRSFQALRRASGTPDDLQRELRRTIRWEPKLASLQDTILIVGENERDVIARLRFVRCLTSPNRQPVHGPPSKAPTRRPHPDPFPLGTIY